jgi:hypothetical protein
MGAERGFVDGMVMRPKRARTVLKKRVFYESPMMRPVTVSMSIS